MKNTLKSRLDLLFSIKEHSWAERCNRPTVLLLLFGILLLFPGTVLASPAYQPAGPSAELVISRYSSAGQPGELKVNETAQASLQLTNFPSIDFTKLTLSCRFDPALVVLSGFTSSGFFGTSEIIDRKGPEAGALVIDFYPGVRPWQSSGPLAGFDLTALSTGTLAFDCSLITTGADGVPTTVTVTILPVRIVKGIQSASVKGSVTGFSPVTISLFTADTVTASITPESGGSFEISAPAGEYRIIASAPGCLSLSGMISLAEGYALNLSAASLAAGDLNTDGIIDNSDVTILAENFYSSRSSTGVNPDLNQDGIVNVLDLEIIARNFGKSSQTDWK